MVPAGTQQDFAEQENVLVYHGPLLYEAKVLEALESRTEPGARCYLVHFIGWNRCYDTVVSREAVLPRTSANLELAEQLYVDFVEKRGPAATAAVEAASHTTQRIERVAQGNTEAPLSASTTGCESAISAAHVRNDEVVIDGEDDVDEHVAIYNCRGLRSILEYVDPDDPLRWFELPTVLKRTVLDDFEYVSESGRLYPLPAQVTVAAILHAWVRHRKRTQDTDAGQIRALAESLQRYFNEALSSMLLYEDERPQYAMVTTSHPGKRASEIYGGEHLLRLMVKLPWFLEQLPITRDEVRQFARLFQDLCRFLLRNHYRFFSVVDGSAQEESR